MLRTTLAGLRLHASRYVTTTLAILLGVMFISGTMVFADTLNDSYEETVMGSATSVDAIAVPEEPESPQPADGPPEQPVPFDQTVLDDVRALPEVAEADGLIEGQAVLLDSDGRAFGQVPPAAMTFGDTTRFSPSEGALPASSDEIALATSTADQSGFDVGDTVTVLDPEQAERDFTVTGLVNFGVSGTYGFRGGLVFDQETAGEMTGASGYSEINVLASEGVTDSDAAAAVASVTGTDVSTGTEYGEEMAENAGGQTDTLRIGLLLFGVIAMFVAGIVIYNTFAILVAQRQRELALLRCVGAKRGQVFRSVLTESFVVGLIASALGVLAGVGIGMLAARFGGQMMGTDVTASVVISPTTVIVGLLVGTLMTVASALIPATRATRVAPLAALRASATAAGLEKGTGWIRVLSGLAAFAVAAALIGMNQMTGPGPNGLFTVVGAALIAFVGVVVLGPLLVRGIVRLVGIPLRRVGVPSMLAVDNSTRSPRRAATAMIALTVGATLITGYSVVSSSLETTMTQMLDEQFPVDYQISPQFGLDEESAAEVGTPGGGDSAEGSDEALAGSGPGAEDGPGTEDTVEDDTGLDGLARIPAQVRQDLEGSAAVDKVFSERSGTAEVDDAAVVGRDGSVPVTTYVGADLGTDIQSETVEGDLADLDPAGVVVSEDYADGHRVGDTFTFSTPEGDLDLEIVAITEAMQMVSGATVDTEDFAAMFPDETEYTSMMVQGVPDADPAELRADVYGAVDDQPALQVESAAEMRNQFSEMMDIAFYTIAAMLGLAIIIAVFGISNTMALSVLERTRESALLRALGLTKGQLRRMLSIEAVLLCLIGAGIGIVMGVVFGWAAGAAVLPDLMFSIPTAQITVFIGVALLAGLLAAVLPARRAAGTSITGALASE
ncbi:ABC transporter permease [Nocardiopsis nanhaiensis]